MFKLQKQLEEQMIDISFGKLKISAFILHFDWTFAVRLVLTPFT